MISPTFLTQLTALQTAVIAAEPIENAPVSTLASLQSGANTLIVALDAAVVSTDVTIIAPFMADVGAFVAAIVALTQAVQDEIALVELRAFAGRIAVTIANVGV